MVAPTAHESQIQWRQQRLNDTLKEKEDMRLQAKLSNENTIKNLQEEQDQDNRWNNKNKNTTKMFPQEKMKELRSIANTLQTKMMQIQSPKDFKEANTNDRRDKNINK